MSPKIWTQAEVDGMIKYAREQSRALAMEEAARNLDENWAEGGDAGPDEIRALAPMPAGLVVMPRETLEEAQLTLCLNLCPRVGSGHQPQCIALSALLEVKT